MSSIATTALRDRCAIVGTGKSKLGRVPGVGSLGLIEEAIGNAIEESGLSKQAIDGMICRGPGEYYTFHQVVAARLGINASFSTTVDNGGASPVLSVILAVLAIEAGLATTVVCAYGRDAWSRTRVSKEAKTSLNLLPVEQLAKEFGPEYGYFGAPAMHAFGARRHMFEFGTTRDHFAAVAIDFREHACRNPDATMREPLTIEAYRSARMIVDPFGLYDCSLVSDAAGAVIVTSMERALSLRQKPVAIKGVGTFNNTRGWLVDDHMVRTAAVESGRKAYHMAGLGPQDIDTAQLYDAFTYLVIAQLEDYGFCAKGEGGQFAASGALRLGGALPTNTSGGQLSEAHAEGMLQIVEGARQLQGVYCSERQVKDAEVALIAGHGGNAVCHSTLILGKV